MFRRHFIHKYKTSGSIYKRWCWITQEFDGGGKLIKVCVISWVIKVLLIAGVIDYLVGEHC